MLKFLNKHVWIHIEVNSKSMYYDATVNSITDTHITFTDKFGDTFTYRVCDVVEIKGFKEKRDDDDR